MVPWLGYEEEVQVLSLVDALLVVSLVEVLEVDQEVLPSGLEIHQHHHTRTTISNVFCTYQPGFGSIKEMCPSRQKNFLLHTSNG